jgi:hypothetical protein
VGLRDDITVLTYNYDTYLDFLLYRALEKRREIILTGKADSGGLDDNTIKELVKPNNPHNQSNAVTSGFSSLGNLDWLDAKHSKPSFCVLKLHGSICYRLGNYANYKILFEDDVYSRAKSLFDLSGDSHIPPILFPWEIMNDKDLIDESSFPFIKTQPELYLLFKGIWERARREVLAADKISFVGLSMHPFLSDGLKYLFDGKSGRVEICVANPDNTPFIPGSTETHWQNLPNSPAHAVSRILGKVAPKIVRWGKVPRHGTSDGDITLVKDFSEFIRTQISPATDY